ncbi:hypothetical protein [Zhongshania aliphaticivorans]|jgi:uncharacterized protein (DUF983 family)|uniref:hypothetical protein n=1 Tax=Zhongshania aliphaticivorans TaxID=1470434 RepID=UPI0012E941C2|nr:hypothetical protein [Zhongshania aliphaticivorans]
MDNCKGCGEKYDYTDRENLVSFGIVSNTTRCPNCGHEHRTDYLSAVIVAASFGLIVYALFLLISTGGGDIYKNTKELSILAIGVIGVFLGFKSIKLISSNET